MDIFIRKTDIGIQDVTTFSRHLSNGTGDKHSCCYRQAKLTTPPFTIGREACLVINQLSWPPSGSCRAQRAGSLGGLGGGRGGGQPEDNQAALFSACTQTSPALLRLLVLSEHLHTVPRTKSALSSHKTSQPAENRGTKRTK